MKYFFTGLILALLFGGLLSDQATTSKANCKLAKITGDSSVCKAVFSKLVYPDSNTGKLTYKPYNNGGDKILDFSTAGYNDGQTNLPTNEDITVVQTLKPDSSSKDDTKRIQAAINSIAKRKLDKNGFRGAVQLAKGKYTISGGLNISSSGTVLQGDPKGGTVITVNVPPTQVYIFTIQGPDGQNGAGSAKIVEAIPVGQSFARVDKPNTFKVGDQVRVNIRYNEAWIAKLGMNKIMRNDKNHSWTPQTIFFLRRIIRIDKDSVYFNSPITTRYDSEYDQGIVTQYTSNFLSNVGVQDLEFQFPVNKDRGPTVLDENNTSDSDYRFAAEMFSNILFYMQNVENSWLKNVRSVWFRNFIRVDKYALAITLQNCLHTFPHTTVDDKKLPSLVGQFAFEISGQQILMDQCRTEYNFHSFAFKGNTPGPNVVRNSVSIGTNEDIGPHLRWSTGQLYENCTFEGSLRIENRFALGGGHGWSAANCVVWNTIAKSGVVVQQPPTAQNFLIGSTSKKANPVMPNMPWAYQESPDHNVYPFSLYASQLKELRKRSNTTTPKTNK